jgi:hypothetical protein
MHGPINVKSPNNTSKWQMGFNSAFKGLRCRWRYSYVNHVDEWEEEVLKLHEFLTYTICGNKWSAAHVGRFVLVEMTAWRMCCLEDVLQSQLGSSGE